MALFNMTELRAKLRGGDRLMGIDLGSKVIGVAMSDVGLALASPYGSLRRGKLAANAAEIRALSAREGVGGLVVGLPLSMDGSFGRAAQAARDWARALSDAADLPAAMWDERLTSSSVQDFLVEQAGLNHRRRAAVVDRMAAAAILQAALDAERSAALTPTRPKCDPR